MSNVNGFTTSKTLKGCHFNRMFFKDMSKTRVMNHTSTARIDSMMAVAKMFDNEVSAERKASMFCCMRIQGLCIYTCILIKKNESIEYLCGLIRMNVFGDCIWGLRYIERVVFIQNRDIYENRFFDITHIIGYAECFCYAASRLSI